MIQLIKRSLGAELSAPDNRNIMIARVQKHVERPKAFYFDDSKIPVEDQLTNGSCVGQAEGGEIECRELMDTGQVTPVSKRWIYAQCKLIDGHGGEGTFPMVAANIIVAKGAPKKEYCEDDNTLPHHEFIQIPADSAEIKSDASLRVAAGYAFVPNILEEILQTIYQKGTYTATLQCGDWDKVPVKPTPSRGLHRIRFKGYREIENDALIWFRNSWNKKWTRDSKKIKLTTFEKKLLENGDGYFLFSEYKDFIFEQIAYTDIPYALIMEARSKKYIFTRDLQYGMRSTDVMELQKRLAKEIAKDGLPCFRYPNPIAQQFTTFFGLQTEDAVERYQEKNNIAKPGTLGYGRVGPKTRASLNSVSSVGAPLSGVKRKIIINAGHDNSDPGAVGATEAEETKKIRDAAVIELKSAGFEVHEIKDDRTLSQSISDANKAAPNLNDALLIDIHLNSSSDKNARGIEAYHGTSETSKKIAESMASNLSKSLGIVNRGAKPDTETHVGSLGWLRKTKAWATLVEVGFISNKADMAILRGKDGYKKAGKGIANAVMELFGASDPSPKPEKQGIEKAKGLASELLKTLNEL